MIDVKLMNGISLAYIGDAVYEVYVREFFIQKGFAKVKDLHNQVTKYTSGIQQAKWIHYFIENNILTEEELLIFKRGRNSHIHTARKNMNIQDYMDATGFEAIIGYLYMENRQERLKELLGRILGN